MKEMCFWFGKYAGVPVKTVLKRDTGYIKWCINNLISGDLELLGIKQDMFDSKGVYVYRLYGFSGQLLYVGQTLNIEERVEKHTERFVFKTVKYQTVEDKEAALNLEAYLISELKPEFNVQLIKNRVELGSKLSNAILVDYDFEIPDYCGIYWDMLSSIDALMGYGDLNKYLTGSPHELGGIYYHGFRIDDTDLYIGYYEYLGKSKAVIYCEDDNLNSDIVRYLGNFGIKSCRSSKRIVKKIPNKLLVSKISSGWMESENF